MIHTIDSFVRRHELIQDNTTIVVGVSGGPDSMALLYYLLSKQSTFNLDIIVVTINHGMRGDTSKEDVIFVENFCKKHDVVCYSETVDVYEYLAKNGGSTQVGARALRYDCYRRAIERYEADYLALGHHGDDQIETMLMQMTRGGYGEGKAGIPIKRPFGNSTIIRPFLCVDKEEILAFCQYYHIDYREDASNNSDHYKRNRYRKYILPFLKKENDNVHTAFQQTSEWLRDDFHYLNEEALASLNQATITKKLDNWTIDLKYFYKAPISLQRRMIHLILNYLYNNGEFNTYNHEQASFESVHIENLVRWLKDDKASGEQHLPSDIVARKSYHHLRVGKQPNVFKPYDKPLEVPGVTSTPAGSFHAELHSPNHIASHGRNAFICDWELLVKPLRVRTRKTGDRMCLKGMTGTKKVKDIFIDQKVPRDKRDIQPIVVDGEEQILWIPALRHGKHPELHQETKRILVLTFTPSARF